MSQRIQRVGYTTAALAAVTPLARELMVDTTKDVVVVGDGSTLGGFAMAREDLSNVDDATNAADGKMSAAHVIELEALRTELNVVELGGFRRTANAVSSTPYSLVVGDLGKTIVVTGTADVAINAAAVATLASGFHCKILNRTTGTRNTVTIDANSTETVETALTYVLKQDESIEIYCNGAKLFISGIIKKEPAEFGLVVCAPSTTLTTGTAKEELYMPYACVLNAAFACLSTVSSSGIPTFDVNKAGTSIFGAAKLTIDASEFHSGGAATAVDFATPAAFAAGDRLSIDCDVAGTGAKGAKVILTGYKL